MIDLPISTVCLLAHTRVWQQGPDVRHETLSHKAMQRI